MSYTPTPYMDHTHPDAFLDWEKKSPAYGSTVECPRCKGFGGWNLKTNCYSMPQGYADTPQNRHLYVHFRTVCGHCNGWGFITPEEAAKCSGHDWKWVKNLGRCYNLYECVHCGAKSEVDSRD